jgi:hypothetical protein
MRGFKPLNFDNAELKYNFAHIVMMLQKFEILRFTQNHKVTLLARPGLKV